MAIPELEPSSTHLVYLILSFFLILYALFSEFIRNRCHLSEPPLATLTGIAFGPVSVDVLGKVKWRLQDNITQEMARVITGVQVFTAGIELPPGYVKRHWRSLTLLLAPNMAFGWCASAAILKLVLHVQWSTAFICAACLTPTDPVLSASVLGEAKFSTRIPRRIRHLLSAESGCNDGSAFPFLYAVLFVVTRSSAADWSKMFFLEIILWQCLAGCIIGIIIGFVANRALRYSERNSYTQESTLFVFYFLLAIFSVGVASTLGLDDFLVAFSSGTAFCWDGWFREKTHQMKLPSIIDLLLNSSMFVYFGTIIPWEQSNKIFGVGKLIGCAVLILLLRRIPAFMALRRFLPELRTWREAIFAGHFGPMGVGAMFLAMEARGRLEHNTSTPLPHPPHHDHPHQEAISAVWPVISIVVLASIMVHGFSAIVMSLYGHFARPILRRASVPGGEQERLSGFASDDGTFTDEEAVKSDNEEDDGLESSEEEEAQQGNGAIRVG